MAKDNLSAVLHEVNDLRIEQRPYPEPPGINEVILSSQSVGICGSDVHFVTHGKIGPFVLNSPTVMGHETSAVVVAVGPGVGHFKPGDRVAVEPQIPCRVCAHCKKGRYSYCPNTQFFGTPPTHGSLCRFFKHAADFCFKLPDNVSFEEASLMEPLTVAVHACNRAGLKVASNVLITGSGPIGLTMILVTKAFGASRVVVTDINEQRLAMAKDIGADEVVLIKPDGANYAEKVVQLLGREPDFAFECSGAESSCRLAIDATELGGVITLVGMGSPTGVNVPLTTAICKELDIRTSLRYSNCYDTTMALISDGRIDRKSLAKLITHRFPLEKALDAFEVVKRGEGIKVMIDCCKRG